MHLLLAGVRQIETTNPITHVTEKTPIFRYYRYYEPTDSQITLGEAKLGELDPEAMSNGTMAKEEVKGKEVKNRSRKGRQGERHGRDA